MSGFAHCFHLVMTMIFLPWLLVWICCAVSAGKTSKQKDRELMRHNTEALEKLAKIEVYKGYRE